jgi:hypothetical protein
MINWIPDIDVTWVEWSGCEEAIDKTKICDDIETQIIDFGA